MSCCEEENNHCSSVNTTTKENLCPTCTNKGKRVQSITLKAMLNKSLEKIGEGPFFFCKNKECSIAYFSTNTLDQHQIFQKSDIRVPIFQKEKLGKTPVCYCFMHTPESIQNEILTKGTTTVVQNVSTLTKSGHCACEIRNPQGSCCLNNLTLLIKDFKNLD